MKRLYIFGGKSTALEMAETALLLYPGREVIHVIGPGEEAAHLERYVRLPALDSDPEAGFILSMTRRSLRLECLRVAIEKGLQPETLVHPQAWVAPSARLGAGSFLAPGARISTGARLGSHALVNLNATIGHETSSGTHLVVNPGAAISGEVTFGDHVLVGANAFIRQGLRIGDGCRIDALAHVAVDLDPGSLCTSRELRVFPPREEAPHE